MVACPGDQSQLSEVCSVSKQVREVLSFHSKPTAANLGEDKSWGMGDPQQLTSGKRKLGHGGVSTD